MNESNSIEAIDRTNLTEQTKFALDEISKMGNYFQQEINQIFSLTTEIVKKLLSTTRNKKKKHDKIFMLAKSKLNNIETLISQALIDMEISHEEYISILKEKNKYEKMKENLKSENEKQEIMRLSSIKSKT